MQDLLERIQASEEEITTHLETIHACQIDGKLRFVIVIVKVNRLIPKMYKLVQIIFVQYIWDVFVNTVFLFFQTFLLTK